MYISLFVVRPICDVQDDGIQQCCCNVQISEPQVLQESEDHACKGLKLKSVKYSVREIPQGGDGSGNASGQENFVDFKQPYSPNEEVLPTDHPQSRVIHSLKPGRRYEVKLQANYSTGDDIDSEPCQIDTPPYTGIIIIIIQHFLTHIIIKLFPSGSQKTCCCCLYICLYSMLVCILFLSLGLCSAFGVYQVMLNRHTACTTDYILSADSAQCGAANSLQFETLKVSGDLQTGDRLIGVLQAWSVKKRNLIFYSKLLPPRTVTANNTDSQPILLQGWDKYTWTGSVIYGYCCIINHGNVKVTANLYIFITDADIVNFVNGQGAQNWILSDSITIPPGKQQCFHHWDHDSPYTVSHSSYHFIGVDMPGNTTYTSNVTVYQKYVNGSDYGEPHFFQYDNTTSFQLSKGRLFSREEYVIVCRAPLYLRSIKDTELGHTTTTVPSYEALSSAANGSLASQVGAESLHISSCKEPHHWMIPFTIMFILGVAFAIISAALCVVTCLRMCKHHRDRLYLSWTRSPTGYTTIQ